MYKFRFLNTGLGGTEKKLEKGHVEFSKSERTDNVWDVGSSPKYLETRSVSQTLLHVIITGGALNNPDAHVIPHTNEIRLFWEQESDIRIFKDPQEIPMCSQVGVPLE